MNENGEAKYERISGMAYGSPVNNQAMNDSFFSYGINFAASASNSGDIVSEIIGSNRGNYITGSERNIHYYRYSLSERVLLVPPALGTLIINPSDLLNPHSDYGCSGSLDRCGVR